MVEDIDEKVVLTATNVQGIKWTSGHNWKQYGSGDQHGS